MNEYQQIFDTISIGLVMIDRGFCVTGWNRWMELHTGITEQEIVGRPLFEFYPGLATGSFSRIVKGVFAFGNYASYSQKLHRYLFEIKNPHGSSQQYPQMQQNCTFGPIRNQNKEITAVYITVHDVTEVAVYEQKLIHLTKVDSLTELYNRGHLDSRLSEEIERSHRFNSPLSIFLLDIDHFKNINDTRGHLCGDYTLRKVSKLLKSLVRGTDILGRYGGEEFCCIMPMTNASQAFVLAERCRTQIAEASFTHAGNQVNVTVSIGIATINEHDTLESLIKRADIAMYHAKGTGRNRTICSTELPEHND